MGFFTNLGIEIDYRLSNTRGWLQRKHLTSFYYKWFLYLRLPKRALELGVDKKVYVKQLDILLNNSQLYRWQYKRLKGDY